MNTLNIRKCTICGTECNGTVLFDITNIGAYNKNDVCICEGCSNNINTEGNKLMNIMKSKNFGNLSDVKIDELSELLKHIK